MITSSHTTLNDNIEISREMIHVYCCRYDRIDEPRLLNHYHSLLNPSERIRWKNIRSDDGKRCFLVSRAMMRTLLSIAVNCPASALNFMTSELGKPYIAQPTTLWQFNLSHSHGLVSLALAYNMAVGIDVEYHDRKTRTLQLARHAFHYSEIEQLEMFFDDEQKQHFFKLWTLKEAYVKAIGCGLSLALDSFSFIFPKQGTKVAMHPAPSVAINCWFTQPAPGYTLASVALRASQKTQQLAIYDYTPLQHCTLKQPHPLTHTIIASSSSRS